MVWKLLKLLTLFIVLIESLSQRFSTWGTRTPGGTPKVHRGYASSMLEINAFKINTKELVLVFHVLEIK